MTPLSETKRLLLEKLLRGEAARQSQHDAIEPRKPGARIPLAPCQSQIWLHSQMNPGLGMYNEPMTVHFRGRLDVDAFHRAFQALIQRHEIWRTTFANIDERVVQAVHDRLAIEIPFHDLTGLPPEARSREATRLATPDATRPMDLGLGPLLRARLFKLDEESFRLYVVMHHLVHDGGSIHRVLMGELPRLYEAFAKGRPSPLDPPRLQYADFAIWQKRFLDNDLAAPQFEYWRKQLAGELRPLDLPTDRPRPAAISFRGAAADFTVPAEVVARIREMSKAEGVSPFMLLMAAYKALLFRYTGQTDLRVGTVVDLRSRSEFADVPGYLMNAMPVRSRPAAQRTFRDYLAEVKEAVLGAIANKDVPYDLLVREIPRDRRNSTLFQAMFNFESAEPNGNPQWTLTQSEVVADACMVDLVFQCDQRADMYAMRVTYCTDLFDASTIDRMFHCWRTLLEGALANPETCLGDLPLLTPCEIEELCDTRNSTRRSIPPVTIHQLFEAQAARTPERIAIESGQTSLTYDQLNRRANRLARRLRWEGAGPGGLVALAVERSSDMLIAVLAILKSGSAYVPIDPLLPEERRDFILRDSQARLILTERELAENFKGSPARIVLCEETAGSDGNLEPLAQPEDISHVLYTSGSTGNPKGVEIPHRAVVNFLESMRREPGFTADDIILAITTLSFDIAGLEMYLPLSVGGKIVLASRTEARDPHLLHHLMLMSRPTVMQATPVTWRALIEAGWKGSPGLKVLCGGESLTRDLAEQLLARSREVWNMYGPTETTIWSTVAQIGPGRGAVPIGRPIDNTQVFVLDERQRPAPPGVIGELYIGGAGLARGYLRRPALNAERFVTCESLRNTRLYRTGDLARWRNDGTLECLGRTDNQVKIRGFRIELEEIETVLARHPSVRAAAVKPWPDAQGNLLLAAYMVADGSPDVRAFLRAKLPDYMIPSRFMQLDELPLTPNLKVDRNRLPHPESQADRAGFVAPATAAERKLAGIWETVLGVEQVGARDNFFDLGGYSLLILKLLSRVEDAFGVRLPMSVLFEAPTVAELVTRLPQDAAGHRVVQTRMSGAHRPVQWMYPGQEMRAITQCLGAERPLISPRLGPSDEARLGSEFTVEQLAALLVDDIRRQQPHGPYTIGGWCDGGILAYEVASQMMGQGGEVDVLVLLDVLNPVVYKANPLRRRASKVMFHLREIATLRGRELRAYLRHRAAWIREKVQPEPEISSASFGARFRRALLRYVPRAYPGRVVALYPARTPRFRDPRLHWGQLVTGLFEPRVVPGTHVSMFEADVAAGQIAGAILDAMSPAGGELSSAAAAGKIRRAS